MSEIRTSQESEYKEELYASPSEGITERYLGLSLPKFLLALSIIVVLAIYLGVLLFGDNSLEVLLQLEEYQEYLQHENDSYMSHNAALQKEYFELKELEPDK
ncbi:MAG: hypothetical protein MUP09_01765 [Thiovulaceae bacterium]|nr:hypothetical protein [Sulfurimonadaceae bacterium]